MVAGGILNSNSSIFAGIGTANSGVVVTIYTEHGDDAILNSDVQSMLFGANANITSISVVSA